MSSKPYTTGYPRTHPVARNWRTSRTTSPTRNLPSSRGFLPALKDQDSAPDYR
jgi:hypothetical protein